MQEQVAIMKTDNSAVTSHLKKKKKLTLFEDQNLRCVPL